MAAEWPQQPLAQSSKDSAGDGGFPEKCRPVPSQYAGRYGGVHELLTRSKCWHHQGFRVGAEQTGPSEKSPQKAVFPLLAEKIQAAKGP